MKFLRFVLEYCLFRFGGFKILTEWNPQFKEKKETEERFAKLETSMTDLKSMLSGLIKELKG